MNCDNSPCKPVSGNDAGVNRDNVKSVNSTSAYMAPIPKALTVGSDIKDTGYSISGLSDHAGQSRGHSSGVYMAGGQGGIPVQHHQGTPVSSDTGKVGFSQRSIQTMEVDMLNQQTIRPNEDRVGACAKGLSHQTPDAPALVYTSQVELRSRKVSSLHGELLKKDGKINSHANGCPMLTKLLATDSDFLEDNDLQKMKQTPGAQENSPVSHNKESTSAASTVKQNDSCRTGITDPVRATHGKRGIKRTGGSQYHSGNDRSDRADNRKCNKIRWEDVLEDSEIKKQFNDCLKHQYQALISMISLQALLSKKSGLYEGIKYMSESGEKVAVDCSNQAHVIDHLGGGGSQWQLLNRAAGMENYPCVKYKKGEPSTIEVDLDAAKKLLPFVMEI
ncbi:hypothetical protein [Endozoicomonas sp.]|uniref:hypothetical protein n=1 Tax=Endozoicomonas sp. TaxID=1892382 RepID=UPI002885D28C|nr:hypothetical protein [Endozoicomonas sp.]